jgi:hypothetical protein
MTTRRTEPTHDSPSQPEAATAEFRRSSPDDSRAEAKADQAPRDAASGVESPSADRMQGSNGPLHQPDPDDNPAGGDQDIDTAGTDADDQSPTKAIGTGIARPGSRG